MDAQCPAPVYSLLVIHTLDCTGGNRAADAGRRLTPAVCGCPLRPPLCGGGAPDSWQPNRCQKRQVCGPAPGLLDCLGGESGGSTGKSHAERQTNE
eukprot:365591-Chlamydomonas_euryale.AAC.11